MLSVRDPAHLLERHLFLDVETTGLDAANDEIIELGAVLVEQGRIVSEHEWLVRPGRPVPAVITALTGLDDEALAGAPSFDELEPFLRPLFRDVTVVAHNAVFERAFLRGLLDEVPVLDSCELALVLFPELPSHSLEALVQWAGLGAGPRHRALTDASDTFAVVTALLQRACSPDRRLQLQSLAQRVFGHAPMHRLLAGLADAAFFAPASVPALTPTRAAPALPAALSSWARQPTARALELEVPGPEAVLREAAGRVGGNVWIVCPHARLKRFGPLERLPSRSASPSPGRLQALLARRVVLDPTLATAMGYLESWGARGAPASTPLSSFWRDRVPLFDSFRTLARERREAPPPPGVFVGTHHDVCEWLEVGVRPDALIWLDAPVAVELERRRLCASLELSRLFRLPELCDVATPGRPVTAGLQAVHARTRELAQQVTPFVEPTRVERTSEGPWLPLKDALTALGRDLGWWLSELRAAPPSKLLDGVIAEAGQVAEIVHRLTGLDSAFELFASASGLWLKPLAATSEASMRALTAQVPTLFVSDVRRAPGWEGRLGAPPIDRAGRGELGSPLAITGGLEHDEALVRLTLSHTGPLTVLCGEPLSEALVGAFVAQARAQGRRVRLSGVAPARDEVVLKEWWGTGPVPEVEGPVVVLEPGDPLALRRLAVERVAVTGLVLRRPFNADQYRAALDGLIWHLSSGALPLSAPAVQAVVAVGQRLLH